jgi:hypothetical protein
VSDSRTTIAVFGVARVKPHVEREGLAFGLVLYEFNPTIDDQLRLMSQAAVGLFLVELR